MIRECYDKLRELAVWGYILSAVLMSTGQLDNDLSDFIGRLEKICSQVIWLRFPMNGSFYYGQVKLLLFEICISKISKD